jgi:uncharacterized membrane protein YagU involved in acid resistance
MSEIAIRHLTASGGYMDISSAIWAGLIGTAVMTVLIYAGPTMGMPKMDMIGMLGKMFTGNGSIAYPLGTIIHFMMGALFAIVYAWLWSLGLGSASWGWGIVYGLVHGLVAAMVMPMMIRMHPRPPEMRMGPMTVTGILMGHLVFGLTVALVYAG